ncbi:MAG: sulfite exporter TauE/SafE family protein [Pseudomonadota bacterium]
MSPLLDFASPAFVAIAVAVFIGGFMRGFVGFGGAVVSVPILSVVLGPVIAVPVANLMALPAIFQLLPAALRHGEVNVVLPLSVGVFLAAPIGCFMLVSIDDAAMKIIISTLVLLLVFMMWRQWTIPGAHRRDVLFVAGTVGGLVQGSSGIGGPPVVAMAMSRNSSPEATRGNVLGIMTTVTVASLAPLAYFGLFNWDNLVLGTALFPVYSLSTWLGARHFARHGRDHYRAAALWVLATVGVVTLVLAIREY